MTTHADKVAFITGANRGIGYETAKHLGELGITVILGVRDLGKGQEAALKLQALGIESEAIPYDANQPESANSAYNYFDQKFGKLDILVNNAGISIEPLLGSNNSSSVSKQVLHESVLSGRADTSFVATYQEGSSGAHRESVQYFGLPDTAQHA